MKKSFVKFVGSMVGALLFLFIASVCVGLGYVVVTKTFSFVVNLF